MNIRNQFKFNFLNKITLCTRFSQILSVLLIIITKLCFAWNLKEMLERSIVSIDSYRTNINFNDMIRFKGFSFKKDVIMGKFKIL